MLRCGDVVPVRPLMLSGRLFVVGWIVLILLFMGSRESGVLPGGWVGGVRMVGVAGWMSGFCVHFQSYFFLVLPFNFYADALVPLLLLVVFTYWNYEGSCLFFCFVDLQPDSGVPRIESTTANGSACLKTRALQLLRSTWLKFLETCTSLCCAQAIGVFEKWRASLNFY